MASTRLRHVKVPGHPGVTWSGYEDGPKTLEARDPSSRAFISCGSNLRDAVKKRAELVAAHTMGKVNGNPSTRVKVVAEKFRRYHAATVKPSSMATYERCLRNHVLPKWGDVKVSAVTRSGVTAWLVDVPEGTRHLARAVLTMVLDIAVEEGMVLVNVSKGAKLPKRTTEAKRGYAMTPAELDTLVSRFDGEMRAVVEVAYAQALRLGEVVGLRWDDVDFEGRVMTVAEQEYRDGSTGETKGKAATMILTDRAAAVLARLKLAAPHGAEQVFSLSYRSVEERFRRVARKVETAEPVTFHDLRHTCGSVMAQEFPIADVSKFLRHASIKTTMAYYVHAVADEARADAMRRAA